MSKLEGKKVAVLVEQGFEEVELTRPVEELKKAGATVHIVSPREDSVKSWDKSGWGKSFDVDVALNKADADNYDALVLPGGVLNPDKLRMNNDAVEFVKDFIRNSKPIAAICHGPWTLIETGALAGRKLTSYNSIKTDLKNAGAEWVDEKVVVDHGLVTSRNPDDLDAFCEKMIEEFSEGEHEGMNTLKEDEYKFKPESGE
jgi:protease I